MLTMLNLFFKKLMSSPPSPPVPPPPPNQRIRGALGSLGGAPKNSNLSQLLYLLEFHRILIASFENLIGNWQKINV